MNDPSKNRDPRTVPVLTQASTSPTDTDVRATIESDEKLGFVADIVDSAHDLDGVDEDEPVDIQIKPAPDGYQIDWWWTGEDGNSRQNSTHIELADPREE
jgi:hypothetical protein